MNYERMWTLLQTWLENAKEYIPMDEVIERMGEITNDELTEYYGG